MGSWRALIVSVMATYFKLTRLGFRGNSPALTNVTMVSQGGQALVFAAQHPAYGEVVLKVIDRISIMWRQAYKFLTLNLVRSPRVPTISADNIEEDSVWSRLPAVKSNRRFSAGDASQGRNRGQSGLKDENRGLAQFA
ncbi:MAG: hypothetical protein DMF61_15655 [Blastocatellia bacterium AA13]|nr:MAG: hypothetical protein DMF61_15655 [Blastocatellia bacterium AA13]